MRYISILILVFISINLQGQSIPTGYYDDADGLTGEELKLQLHKIIRNHKVWEYSDFRDTILRDLDEDPDNSDNIILFYKNASIPKDNFASDNQADYWNREHTWAKSHGFPEAYVSPDEVDTAYTDVHNLRPSDATVNTSKSNKDFNTVEHIGDNEEGEAPDTYTDSDFWEPRDDIKGDVARILFYMATRYESETLDLELVNRISYSGDPEFGVLYTMLQWHEDDPVDQYEIDRHEGAYGYQENRNPFVDHPEWVGDIWGVSTEALFLFNDYAFNSDFGTVELGSFATQTYTIDAYNITEDITVTVDAPFYVSLDGETYSNSVDLLDENIDDQSYDVWLKYEPLVSDEEISTEIVHTMGAYTASMSVSAKEGEIVLIDIAEARTKESGEVVVVSGVIIDAGNNSGNSRVVYDGTAGVVVRSFDEGHESANFAIGDSVLIKGGLSEYADLLQIEESPITIELLKSDAMMPDAQVVTISEIGEDYESELVTIQNVTFAEAGGTFGGGGTAGNFIIEDETGSITFRVGNAAHPVVGTMIPTGTCDVTGFVGQFYDDYQFSVRYVEDIIIQAEPIISIEEARSKNEGDIVKVKGIVIGGENNNAHNRVLFDGTAGIVIRSLDEGNESADLLIGDSVVVQGGLLDYNGLLEIEEEPITIEILNSGNELPVAQLVTIAEIDESYESELVTIKSVSMEESGVFAVGEYVLSDGTATMPLKIGLEINSLVGFDIPSGVFDVTGYVSQNNDGYNLYVRKGEDIELDDSVLASSGIEEGVFDVYPNPSNQAIEISLPNDWLYSDVQFSIVDFQGRLVDQLEFTGDQVDVTGLKKGIYLISIVYKENKYTRKFVKI